MGRTENRLPPSEALPGIGEHTVVFHNGTGFYYICTEYSSELDKRLFECVRPECEVTAGMGEGCGSPLIDAGRHSHPPDLHYREKCLLLHNIRRQLCLQEIPASEILRDALSSLQADGIGYVTESSNDPLYEEPPGVDSPEQVKMEMFESSMGCESQNLEILSELTDEHSNPMYLTKAEPFTSLYLPLPEESMMEMADRDEASDRIPTLPVQSQAKSEDEEAEVTYLSTRRALRREMKRGVTRKQHQTLTRKDDHGWRKMRFKVRKTYPREAIPMALEAIEGGHSIRGASRRFGVPEATIRRRYHMCLAEVAGSTWMTTKAIPEEGMIAERVKTIIQDGFPLSKRQLMAIAANTLSEMHSRSECSSRYTMNMKWLNAFLRRHPEIAAKLSEDPGIESQLLDWFCNAND